MAIFDVESYRKEDFRSPFFISLEEGSYGKTDGTLAKKTTANRETIKIRKPLN